MGLYRDTDGTRDGAEKDKVLVDGEQVTCVLNTTNGLYYKFTGLEKYDEDGNLYTYYARELSVGGIPVSGEKVTVNGEDFIVDYDDSTDKTTITNRVEGEIAVHKVWWDGNALNRPESVTVGLYRQDGEALEPVPKPGTDDHYTLMLSAPDWTGTFEDLDEYADGQKITYVVRELEEVEAPPVIEETPPAANTLPVEGEPEKHPEKRLPPDEGGAVQEEPTDPETPVESPEDPVVDLPTETEPPEDPADLPPETVLPEESPALPEESGQPENTEPSEEPAEETPAKTEPPAETPSGVTGRFQRTAAAKAVYGLTLRANPTPLAGSAPTEPTEPTEPTRPF